MSNMAIEEIGVSSNHILEFISAKDFSPKEKSNVIIKLVERETGKTKYRSSYYYGGEYLDSDELEGASSWEEYSFYLMGAERWSSNWRVESFAKADFI